MGLNLFSSNRIISVRMGKDTVFSGKVELYLQMMWQKGRNVGFIEKKRKKKIQDTIKKCDVSVVRIMGT